MEIEERSWGKYFVLADEPGYKLKRIEVLPEHILSIPPSPPRILDGS